MGMDPTLKLILLLRGGLTVIHTLPGILYFRKFCQRMRDMTIAI